MFDQNVDPSEYISESVYSTFHAQSVATFILVFSLIRGHAKNDMWLCAAVITASTLQASRTVHYVPHASKYILLARKKLQIKTSKQKEVTGVQLKNG